MRLAVVGYGNMGRRHLDSLMKLGVEDVVLVRRDPGAPRLPEHAHLEVVRQLGDLDAGRVDAAVVCSPTSRHADDLEACFRLGLPALVEKPIAATLSQIDQLERLYSEPASPPVQVGYDLRFSDTFRAMRHAVRSGALGPVCVVEMQAGGYMPDWRPGLDYRELYSSHAALGGGVLLDLSHELDAMRCLFGDPDTVSATIARKSELEIDTEDVAVMTFNFLSGPVVAITLDYLRRPYSRSYRIVGEQGTLYWDEVADTLVVRKPGASRDESIPLAEDASKRMTAFEKEMAQFLEVAAGRRPPEPNFRDGIAAMRLVEAVRSSSKEGRAIDIPVLPRPPGSG